MSTSSADAQQVLAFTRLIGGLKNELRTGWTYHKDILDVESVADHSCRVAQLGFLAAMVDTGKDNAPLDVAKCVMMGLVHDIAECIVGDLTPRDKVSKQDKLRMESQALDQICSLAGETSGSLIRDVWNEYEARESLESRFVKDMDRYDMLVQAWDYERAHPTVDLSRFFAGTTPDAMFTPEGRLWTQELVDQRDVWLAERNKEVHAARDEPTQSPQDDIAIEPTPEDGEQSSNDE